MLSQRKVAIECDIRPSTLKMYVNNTIQRINKADLESLYNFFNKLDDRITISDIVTFENNN
ncbi:XRE family transcriptional regulator [Clostridium sp. P21]|uniref:XRE family transcriptional regulator n=2 Tax=Clostridium muellerianum TaxID=2716538 RepID=A0A7Y0EDL1_9CLOT|nr:XRE family transcriptional regulator [Clostridium muellerianum]